LGLGLQGRDRAGKPSGVRLIVRAEGSPIFAGIRFDTVQIVHDEIGELTINDAPSTAALRHDVCPRIRIVVAAYAVVMLVFFDINLPAALYLIGAIALMGSYISERRQLVG
jgi:hypothetical protein